MKKSLDSYTFSFVALGVMKGNQIKNGLWKNKIVWLDGKMSQVKDFDGGSKFKIKFFVSGKSVWVKNKLIVCNKCGADSRTKVIKPTKFLKSLMIVDVASKLKTVESISKPFKHIFGKVLAKLFKQHGLEDYKAFTQYDNYDFYKTDYIKGKGIFENTLKKLG